MILTNACFWSRKLPFHGLMDGVGNGFGGRETGGFHSGIAGDCLFGGTEAPDRGKEVVKGMLGHLGGNFSADSPDERGFLHGDGTSGFADTGQNGGRVQRFDGTEVQYFDTDAGSDRFRCGMDAGR